MTGTTLATRSLDRAGTPIPGPGRPSTRSGRFHQIGRWLGLALTVTAVAGATITYLLTPLNNNLRYEMGVHDTSVFSAAGTFSHRPLAYRLLLHGMSEVADRLSFGLSSFEVMLRLLGLGLAVAAGVLLWLGLRARGVSSPGLHAVIAVAAVVFMGRGSLEAGWMAVVLSCAGTGVALLGRGRWARPMAVLAGVLFVGAAGMKIITVLTALIGLLVLAVIDRRQAIRTIVSSTVVGLGYVLATLLWAPWEITWLLDLRHIAQPIGEQLVNRGPRFLLAAVLHWPTLIFVPLALIVAEKRERFVLAVSLALALGLIVAQGKYFQYHAAALCVVAAIAAFRALRYRMTPRVGVGIAVLVVAAIGWTVIPYATHSHIRGVLALGVVAVLAVGVGWAQNVRHRGSPKGRGRPLLAACATLALIYPGMTPFGTSMMHTTTDGTVVIERPGALTDEEVVARRIHARIGGPDVSVTYLTFGTWPYFLQNPTSCHYPSPLFLQRTRYAHTHDLVGSPSYQQNLACLSEPSSRWLIMSENWFKIGKAPTEVQQILARTWNCDAGFERGPLTVCPRRHGTG